MEKTKKFNYVIICGLLVTLIMMSIGYAALSQSLTISGTALIKNSSSSWNIHFSDVNSDKANTASWTTTPTISTTGTNNGSNNTITFACELVAPGDSCETTATIKNGGTVKGIYNGYVFEVNDSVVSGTTTTTADGVVVTLTPATDWEENTTVLNNNDTGTFKIKMELPSTLSSLPTTDSTHKISLTVNFSQSTN